MERTIGFKERRYIEELRILTRATALDCVIDERFERVIYVIKQGDMGLAIGKKGDNIRRLQSVLGKKVEMVEHSEDLFQFISNMFKPAELTQPEGRVREFISKLTPPSPVDLDIEKGQGMLLSHHWSDAEINLRNALSQKPESAAARLGLAKALLAQNNPVEALGLLTGFPESRELHTAELIKPLALALQNLNNNNLPEESDLDAIFRNSIHLASQGKFPLALDGLLDIIRQDKQYHNKLPRDVILGILELMGNEDPQTREYRSELASALF